MARTESIQIPATQLLFARLMRAAPSLCTGLGNLETKTLAGELRDIEIHEPIYITGLARSGTTIVTELLSRHSAVTTHHYSDFPMVWTPFWWNSLRKRLPLPQPDASERAHQDRIRITPESPEAVEEVIWMRFFAHVHDAEKSQILDADMRNAAFEDFYRDHIAKLLQVRGAERYLAKGNYNITRLRYLKKLFPDARFVIMVRDPVWHIASLMKQDRLFRALDDRDQRFTEYLKLLGHYEFGAHKRPINLGNNELATEIETLWRSGEDVRAWALYWSALYDFVCKRLAEDSKLKGNCLVLKYEDLCADPSYWSRQLIDHCQLDSAKSTDALAQIVSTIAPPDYYQPSFTNSEQETISELTDRTRQQLGYA